MNISVKGEYALQAVYDLSTQARGEPIKIAAIAQRQKIPQKFLELILASLKQGGFVESRRGAEGGYFLAKSPDLITVGQVIRYMEGHKALGRSAAALEGEGPFSALWREVEGSISSVVDHTSFADLARQWREKQQTYVPNWEI